MDLIPTPTPSYCSPFYFIYRGILNAPPLTLLVWLCIAGLVFASVVIAFRRFVLLHRVPARWFFQLAHLVYLAFLGLVGVGGQLVEVSHPDAAIVALIVGEILVSLVFGSLLVLFSCVLMAGATSPPHFSRRALIGITAVWLSLVLQMGTVLIAIVLKH